MGLSGPIPISDAQRKRTGEKRPSAQKDNLRVTADPAKPNRPAWLSGEARNCWQHIVPLLEEQGTVARADRNALIRYCVTYGKWLAVAKEFSAEDATHVDKDHVQRKSPLFQIYRDLGTMLGQLEQEFGLTPKARMRIAPAKEVEDDPYAGILDNRASLG